MNRRNFTQILAASTSFLFPSFLFAQPKAKRKMIKIGENKYFYESLVNDEMVSFCIETPKGDKSWWYKGNLHRTDGPAVERCDGTKQWWIDGELHREDGPALEYPNDRKEWRIHGKKHRIDGPAVEYISGRKEWYLNNMLHRTDGPAVEFVNGDKIWYLHGKITIMKEAKT